MQRNVQMRNTQPSYMDRHRIWLLKILEANAPPDKASRTISRHRRPVLYKVRYDLSWDLVGFLRDQEYGDRGLHTVIGKVITLTGDGQFVQALSCREYMEQIWPSTAGDFIALLERMARNSGHRQECKSYASNSLSYFQGSRFRLRMSYQYVKEHYLHLTKGLLHHVSCSIY